MAYLRVTEADGSEWVNAEAYDELVVALKSDSASPDANPIVANLEMMLRRIITLARKEIGDTSMKVLAGQASELLNRYGLNGSPLRNARMLPCIECGNPRFEIGILVCRKCWNNADEKEAPRGY